MLGHRFQPAFWADDSHTYTGEFLMNSNESGGGGGGGGVGQNRGVRSPSHGCAFADPIAAPQAPSFQFLSFQLPVSETPSLPSLKVHPLCPKKGQAGGHFT